MKNPLLTIFGLCATVALIATYGAGCAYFTNDSTLPGDITQDLPSQEEPAGGEPTGIDVAQSASSAADIVRTSIATNLFQQVMGMGITFADVSAAANSAKQLALPAPIADGCTAVHESSTDVASDDCTWSDCVEDGGEDVFTGTCGWDTAEISGIADVTVRIGSNADGSYYVILDVQSAAGIAVTSGEESALINNLLSQDVLDVALQNLINSEMSVAVVIDGNAHRCSSLPLASVNASVTKSVAEVTCTPATIEVEVCDDGVDNDIDFKVDCADPDCANDPACINCVAEVCDDDVDNDCDGFVDCFDTDCAGYGDCICLQTITQEGEDGPEEFTQLVCESNFCLENHPACVCIGYDAQDAMVVKNEQQEGLWGFACLPESSNLIDHATPLASPYLPWVYDEDGIERNLTCDIAGLLNFGEYAACSDFGGALQGFGCCVLPAECFVLEESTYDALDGTLFPGGAMPPCWAVDNDCTLEGSLPGYTCNGDFCYDPSCGKLPGDAAAAILVEEMVEVQCPLDEGVDCCEQYAQVYTMMFDTNMALEDPDPDNPGDCCVAVPMEGDCNNGRDDDCDNRLDCDDPDCDGVGYCVECMETIHCIDLDDGDFEGIGDVCEDNECSSSNCGEAIPTCEMAQQILAEMEIECDPEGGDDCCLMLEGEGVLPLILGDVAPTLGECDMESGCCGDDSETPTCLDELDNNGDGDVDCEDSGCEEREECAGGGLPCHGMLSCEMVGGDCTLALFNGGEPLLGAYTCDVDTGCCADPVCDYFPQDTSAAVTYELLAGLMGLAEYGFPETCDPSMMDCCFFYGMALSAMNDVEITLEDPEVGVQGNCCEPDCGALPSSAALAAIDESCEGIGLGSEGICCVDMMDCEDMPSNMWAAGLVDWITGGVACSDVTGGPDDCCSAYVILVGDPPLSMSIDHLIEGEMCCQELGN